MSTDESPERVINVQSLADLSAKMKEAAASIKHAKATTPDDLYDQACALKNLIDDASRKRLIVWPWGKLFDESPISVETLFTAIVSIIEKAGWKPVSGSLVERLNLALEWLAEWIWQTHAKRQEERQRAIATPESFIAWLLSQLDSLRTHLTPTISSSLYFEADPFGTMKCEAYRLARAGSAKWGFGPPPFEPTGQFHAQRAYKAIDTLRVWAETSHSQSEAAKQKMQDAYQQSMISGAANLPMLSAKAATIYELLLKLPPYRGMTGPKILDALSNQGEIIDQSTLTKTIVPELRPYGIENVKRIGYRINPARRPSK